MADKKNIPVSLSTIFLIIAIIVILVLGCVIFIQARNNKKANLEIENLKAENQKLTTTINEKQEEINSLNRIKTNIESALKSANTTTTQQATQTTQKTEQEKMQEVAKAFVKAVNEKDYVTAEKYSNINIVNDLKTYKVYNMTVDTNNIQKNPNEENAYYCSSNYEIDYNGQTKKDVALGGLFCLEKSGETYKVTAFGATGL